MSDEQSIQLIRDASVRFQVTWDGVHVARHRLLEAQTELAAARQHLAKVWHEFSGDTKLVMPAGGFPIRSFRRRLRESWQAFRLEWTR